MLRALIRIINSTFNQKQSVRAPHSVVCLQKEPVIWFKIWNDETPNTTRYSNKSLYNGVRAMYRMWRLHRTNNNANVSSTQPINSDRHTNWANIHSLCAPSTNGVSASLRPPLLNKTVLNQFSPWWTAIGDAASTVPNAKGNRIQKEKGNTMWMQSGYWLRSNKIDWSSGSNQ